MTSISFDPVAHRYDATRSTPEAVVQQIVKAVDQEACGNQETHLLEVGVGTGRYALPLAQLGRQYTGIDISEKMLSQLCEKLPRAGWQEVLQAWGNFADEDSTRKVTVQRFVHQEKQGSLRLVVADMTAIPFADASFDAVIASHVFHLVGMWQEALQEIMRVLRPGGMLLQCQNSHWEEQWQPGLGDIRRQWCLFAQELGGQTQHPGASDQQIEEWLRTAGLVTEQVAVFTWQQKITPRAIFEGIAQRLWTSTLMVPDDIFVASVERLREWMNEHYDDLDKTFTQEQRLVVCRTQV